MYRDPRTRTRSLAGRIAAVFLAVGVTPVLAGPLAYLSNLDDPSITVVDTTSLTETATIPLPGMPSAIVAGASGTRVYVSYLNDAPTGGLAVIDVATQAVRTVSFGQVAAGLDVDAAEGRAFVADVAEVAVVDLAGPSLATTFSDGTRFPFDVAIDHTTRQLYVTNFDGFVSVHDGTTFAPIASIPADFELQILALSHGSTIGVANSGLGITIFDTSTNTATGEVPTGVTPSEADRGFKGANCPSPLPPVCPARLPARRPSGTTQRMIGGPGCPAGSPDGARPGVGSPTGGEQAPGMGERTHPERQRGKRDAGGRDSTQAEQVGRRWRGAASRRRAELVRHGGPGGGGLGCEAPWSAPATRPATHAPGSVRHHLPWRRFCTRTR
jgi:YVTN family beta-propeller protein